jgi:DNA-binding response OmpR family regulator
VIQNPTTILIVDDNPDVSDVITIFLTRVGFRTLAAKDGEAACEMAERETPSLIICDERMPGMDGYSTLLKLKGNTNTAQIPVIMIGGTDINGERDWQSYGAASFLPKPFQLPELLARVRETLLLPQLPSDPSAAIERLG